ncbi:TetR/AcrR family transcriptional regulator [Mycobacterium florentinum]|nr:TetR/AcrR family transcriptional regulator [Mycobacterium florentinum]MCV7412544.1 TetR/AcrR family transcriptional regulator [Mycobacterium florentinum]
MDHGNIRRSRHAELGHLMTTKTKNGNPQTRQAILDALERTLENRPLGEIAVTDILAEAGLSSRTTFYQHFGGRDEAFVALVGRALNEIGNEVTAVIHDASVRRTPLLRKAVDRWMVRGGRHWHLARNMLLEWPRIPEFREIFVAFMTGLSEQLAAAIDEDRRAGLVVTAAPSSTAASMALWSAERAMHATMVGAYGFASSAATADALVAQHLALVYGVNPTAK